MTESSATDHSWTFWLLAALAAEKIVQHAAVTGAFVTDRFGLRSSVAVDYRWLAFTGAGIGLLYALALAGLLGRRRWSRPLLAVLALADIAGEFIAQGTLFITLNVSFLVALVILLVLALTRQQVGRRPTGTT